MASFFPEKFDYYPSEKEGFARLAGLAVLLSSGSGEMADAAAWVAYAKLSRVAKVADEILIRATQKVDK